MQASENKVLPSSNSKKVENFEFDQNSENNSELFYSYENRKNVECVRSYHENSNSTNRKS